NYALIEQQFDAPAKMAISSEKLREVYDNLHAYSGKITFLGKPEFFGDGIAVYPVDCERRKMELIIALDSEGKIRGLEINAKKTDISRNKTRLSLPFKGEWTILLGGDTVEQNYHQAISLSRFAFDFLKVDKMGKTYRGDGKKNEDYYSFGQKILAP